MFDSFTEEEKAILEPFFTNLDKDVFALRNLPEVVKGALFARYSRSDKSLRRVLLDEFIKKPEMGFKQIVRMQTDSGVDQIVAIQKAEEFYERVLIGFGDDSVAELGGAHLAVENISNIATKVIEDARIGICPLEKSTRYVYFDQKPGGKYMYYRDKDIMESRFADLYINTMDMLFDTYSSFIEPMRKFLMERFPNEGMSERAYKSTIRAKVCDIIRVLLPTGTLTNVGLFGNGRAFDYLLTKMYAHPMREMRDLAAAMQEELRKVIPPFVKRCNDEKHGKPYQAFLRDKWTIAKLSKEILRDVTEADDKESLRLIDYDKDAETKVVAAILYPMSSLPMAKIREKVARMSSAERKKVINAYVAGRTNRRHKPGRAFENVYYTFDILGDYGIYRDIQRHRILTQERQLITTKHGYDVPVEIEDADLADKFREAMDAAAVAFEKISMVMPLQAQYVVPMGYKIRWYITMNLREAYHLCELRTCMQGHPTYRKLAQNIYKKIKEVHPVLAEGMKFVDMNDYSLERKEAEKRIDKKIEEIKRKYGYQK
ncbi:MAG: FAD-dependent thymidylate synthase [Candidatus Aenigmarchaeota archaeon]|nr:FAD-dependent thymidylate synthase [Candidatus Aenigmarchaeota archaeon]